MARKITRKKVDNAAKAITKAVGAKNLARYAGETMARRKNKSIKRTVTAKQARRSGAALAGTIAGLAAGGAVGGVAKAASNAKKLKAAKAVAKTKKADAKFAKFVKRTYSGYEKSAMRQAKKRNAAKKKK